MRFLAGVFAVFALALGPADTAFAHEEHAAPVQSVLPPPTFDYTPPEAGTYALPPLGPAADGVVLDTDARPLHLADLFREHLTILAFVYTRCTDVCPLAQLELAHLREALSHDPALADRAQILSLSFDPDYDTPAVMAEQAEMWTADAPARPPWRFLTARDAEALAPVLAAYDQPVARKMDPDDPTGPLHHLLRVFLIDETATIRNIYSLDVLDPRLLLADLRTLTMDEGQ